MTDSKKDNIIRIAEQRLMDGCEKLEGSDKPKSTELPDALQGPFTSKEIMDFIHTGEDGDSAIFIRLHRDEFVYDHATKEWYYWNEHYWRLDEIDQVVRSVEKAIAEYHREIQRQKFYMSVARQKEDKKEADRCEKKIKLINKRKNQLHTVAKKNNVLKMARSGVDALGISGKEWNKNPMLLACKNGCINLEAGEFYDGIPTDYINIASPIKFVDFDEPCPVWEEFLLTSFNGNIEIVKYIQRLLGYCLTGKTIENIYPILWGERGRNGKTTMLETIKHVMGDLAYKAPSDFMMAQFHGKGNVGPDANIMALRGKRLAWCSETNEGDRVDLGKLKELSGGDSLSARAPYGKRMSNFTTSHKLFLLTNRRPRMSATDEPLWKRVHLIPFELSFVDDPIKPYQRKADKHLGEKLKAESSGILTWMSNGCTEWIHAGYKTNPPEIISAATQQYKENEDIIQHFVEECCLEGEEYREAQSKLYVAYKNWCHEVGGKSKSKINFNNDMRTKYKEMKSYEKLWVGLTLR